MNYVTGAAPRNRPGPAQAIDEVADSVERPGATAFRERARRRTTPHADQRAAWVADREAG